MAVNSDPDFELFRPTGLSQQQRVVMIISGCVLMASAAWAGPAWLAAQAATGELRQEAALASQRARDATPVDGGKVAMSAAYADEAIQAAKLLQAPVADWLRELERCQPEGGRTRSLRVDAVQRQVSVSAALDAQTDLDGWVQCLNAGTPHRIWRLVQLTEVPRDAAANISPARAAPRWVAELRRNGG